MEIEITCNSDVKETTISRELKLMGHANLVACLVFFVSTVIVIIHILSRNFASTSIAMQTNRLLYYLNG
jgi:uncharacterized membrane protein